MLQDLDRLFQPGSPERLQFDSFTATPSPAILVNSQVNSQSPQKSQKDARKNGFQQRGYDYFPKKPSQKSKNSLELQVQSPINNQQRITAARENKINGVFQNFMDPTFQRNSEIKETKSFNPFALADMSAVNETSLSQKGNMVSVDYDLRTSTRISRQFPSGSSLKLATNTLVNSSTLDSRTQQLSSSQGSLLGFGYHIGNYSGRASNQMPIGSQLRKSSVDEEMKRIENLKLAASQIKTKDRIPNADSNQQKGNFTTESISLVSVVDFGDKSNQKNEKTEEQKKNQAYQSTSANGWSSVNQQVSLDQRQSRQQQSSISIPSHSQKKKNVLIIKKESINRQSSQSRSPKTDFMQNNYKLSSQPLVEQNLINMKMKSFPQNFFPSESDNNFQSPTSKDDLGKFRVISTAERTTASPKQQDQKMTLSELDSSNQLRQLSGFNSVQSRDFTLNQSSHSQGQHQSVIIRKTVGELKREQQRIINENSIMARSVGPPLKDKQRRIYKTMSKESAQPMHETQEKVQSSQKQFEHRIESKQLSMSKTFEKMNENDLKSSIIGDSLLITKTLVKEDLQCDKLNESSSDFERDEDDFDRASSNQAQSVENFASSITSQDRNNSRKIVIQKSKVNFKGNKASSSDEINLKEENSTAVDDEKSKSRSKSLRSSQFEDLMMHNQNSNSFKQRKSLLHNDANKLEFDMLLQQSLGGNFSQSPECLRRQRSDNLIGISSGSKVKLSHERSTQQLSIYTSNKLDVPKVVKAIPNAAFSELVKSPTSNFSSSVVGEKAQLQKDGSGITKIGLIKGQINTLSGTGRLSQGQIGQGGISITQQQQQTLNKSRQSNIFQMRRSQTFLKERALKEASKAQAEANSGLLNNENDQKEVKTEEQVQAKFEKFQPSKKITKLSQHNEVSRISQSLLLDNFYSKSKDRADSDLFNLPPKPPKKSPRKQLKDESLIPPKKALASDQSERLRSIQSQIYKNQQSSSQIFHNSQQHIAKKQVHSKIESLLTQNRQNSLSQSLNRLIDENRCNSPIRVSQYLVDVDYMKALADERIANKSQREITSSQDIINDQRQIYTTKPSNSKTSEPIEVFVPDDFIGLSKNHRNTMYSSSNSQNDAPVSSSLLNYSQSMMHSSASTNSKNALLSLSQVTKDKFKEVIDNLYVPTASVFKKKAKEKEFRRPTQNPPRRSRSHQRAQQQQNAQLQAKLQVSNQDDKINDYDLIKEANQ